MVIRHGPESIEITLRETGPQGTPAEGDLGVDVTVSRPAFTGRNDTVWIGRDDWTDFLEGLRELDRTRRGEAHVSAMSPEEFRLAIFATDRAGHLAAEGWVGRECVGRNSVMRDRVTFHLEIDPSELPGLVRQFEALAPAGRRS